MMYTFIHILFQQGFVLATNVSAGKINTRAFGRQEEAGISAHNYIVIAIQYPTVKVWCVNSF